MMDKDLHGEQLKLVRYKILFVKRDYEVAFPEKEELVAQSMSEADYSGWKIAEFVQNLHRTLPPELWKAKKYPHPYPDGKDDGKKNGPHSKFIDSIPEDDKRYLRVYFEVLERYDREKFRYEERQIEVLEEIKDILAHKHA